MSLPPPDLRVAELNLYPLKSCAQLRVSSAQVGSRGFDHDRRWLAVDSNGKFLTGRERPALVSIRAEPSGDGVQLSAPGRASLDVAIPDGAARRTVKIWSDTVDAARCDAANDWLSAVLGVEAALVYMDERAERATDPKYSRIGDNVSFADGYPILLTTQASLNDLNQRLARPVGMERFRANIVIKGELAPYLEDDIAGWEIGGLRFENAKKCARCVFTTLDVETLAFDPEREPLRTLSTYRRPEPGKILFGVNLIARGHGPIEVGAHARILD